GYSFVRKGPGVEYEVVDTLLQDEKVLFFSDQNNWFKVYRIEDTTYLGYVFHNRIRQMLPYADNKYVLSFKINNSTGYIGKSAQKGYFFLFPDDVNKDKWQESSASGDFNYIHADSVSKYICHFLLYKALDEFKFVDGPSLSLKSALSCLPLDLNGDKSGFQNASRGFYIDYHPGPHKPLYGNWIETNTVDLLQSKGINYDTTITYYDTECSLYEKHIFFSSEMNGQQYCVIIVPGVEGGLSTSYFFSAKQFKNLKSHLTTVDAEIGDCAKRLLSFDRSSVIKYYGTPFFENKDIIIYITASHDRFFEYRLLDIPKNIWERNSIGRVGNGILFFEIENNRVVFAGDMALRIAQ
ncbi:SH3 domain-containing protein, partial [bacterium]|nr:SH3 domain-containing protein [bacterium]